MSGSPLEGLRAIAFFGGGTGGHLFPGISIAERAKERFPGCRAVFFRTSRAIEEKVFAGRGLETLPIRIGAPGGLSGWVRYLSQALKAEPMIRQVLSRGFDAAFGLGGYASMPGILAARALGLPVILLEQNAVAGRVNRLLSPIASAVACSFEGTRLRLAARAVVTGNPLRREVLEAARAGVRSSTGAVKTVLVVGGSQGAGALNRAVRDALPGLLELREKIYWIHVAGDADKDAMTEAYRKTGWHAEVHAFTPDLPRLMARSDLVVGRAGGTTLSEIAALGVPSVLVPYPHHGDQHQRRNAEAFVRSGGAVLVDESQLEPESIRRVFRDVLFAPERLSAMGRCVQALARPNAADAILDLAVELKNRCPPASASFS